MAGMGIDGSVSEVVRCRFRNGDPALPLRHEARDALRRSATGEPDPVWIDDVLIVVSELIQNVSRHTHGPGELIVSIDCGLVLVEVGDASTTAPHTLLPGPQRAGGRGLMLIEALSREWGVRTCDKGKVVWAQLRTDGDPGPRG